MIVKLQEQFQLCPDWYRRRPSVRELVGQYYVVLRLLLRQRRGFWTTVADNSVLDGIRTVSSMMNRRLLRFHGDNCPRLVERLQSYSWDEKAVRRGEEAPLKEMDDEADCLRYIVQSKIGHHSWRLSPQ